MSEDEGITCYDCKWISALSRDNTIVCLCDEVVNDVCKLDAVGFLSMKIIKGVVIANQHIAKICKHFHR